ncbi:hypothetical protein WMY93_006007 [Mugilogobius chulae]|uniref:Uncharacterized protein n=1 Tax=Mugilogobius chulae TaxID=88201 RepID=A0AAW0PSB2_9GOBI
MASVTVSAAASVASPPDGPASPADGPASPPDGPASLETLLNQATDPQNTQDRWDSIQGFCGTVLEVCMNECGPKFHCEVAKFRFLNELIKVLSVKYFGLWSPEKVKQRLVEVLYGWTLWLRDQPKIQEAYDMLKKQGLVKKDPKLSNALIMCPAPQRSSASIFQQDDTTKLLERLLKSRRPEDLETANRLIKSAMQAEQERVARLKRRQDLLTEVHSTTRQLQDVLQRQTESSSHQQDTQDSQVLFERCDRLRPALFRLASETADDDVALAQVLEANDELTLAIKAYRSQTSAPRKEKEAAAAPVLQNSKGLKSLHLLIKLIMSACNFYGHQQLHSDPRNSASFSQNSIQKVEKTKCKHIFQHYSSFYCVSMQNLVMTCSIQGSRRNNEDRQVTRGWRRSYSDVRESVTCCDGVVWLECVGVDGVWLECDGGCEHVCEAPACLRDRAAPYSPLLPPAALSQVLLLDNHNNWRFEVNCEGHSEQQ